MPYGYDWRYTVQASSTGIGDVKTVTPADQSATAALISVETGAARVTVDGSTPTATNGLLFPTGAPPVLLLMGSDVIKVAGAAGAALVNISWGY